MPNRTSAPPRTPSRRWAAAHQARASSTVVPSRSDAKTARWARRVISQARCMSARSCASLTMRQPAVTGVPDVRWAAGAACAIPSEKAKGIVSSIPTRPVATPRSSSAPATSRQGEASSSQARTSSPIRMRSRARSLSKAGVTQIGSPVRERTRPKKRSESHHSAPVK